MNHRNPDLPGADLPPAGWSDGPWRAGADYPPVPDGVTDVCDNEAVGVLITDPADRYLMLRRATPPVGIAPVAGHVDGHGGTEAAARAEVPEEVGLTVLALTPLTVRWRANICHRRHGPGHPLLRERSVPIVPPRPAGPRVPGGAGRPVPRAGSPS